MLQRKNIAGAFTALNVNNVLRNPQRIFNHAPLIQAKLAIIDKWQLTHTAFLEAYSELQQQKEKTAKILASIAEFNQNKNLAELQNDLRTMYQAGLLELHLTDKCNLFCLQCWSKNRKNETFPFAKLATILPALNPRAVLLAGGGEPGVYSSAGQTLNEAIIEIHRILPDAPLGLISNNTILRPEDSWPNYLQWHRTSLDAATPETYQLIKRENKYAIVVENIHKLFTETTTANVGVGFLYRNENAEEIFPFLEQWFNWFAKQAETTRSRFNIQFRPIAAQVDTLDDIQTGKHPFIHRETLDTMQDQIRLTYNTAEQNPNFNYFLTQHSNFFTRLWPYQEQPELLFSHEPAYFGHCYTALSRRLVRASGTEYPCCLTENDPSLALGNALSGNPDEIYKIALEQVWYYTLQHRYCSAEYCRIGTPNVAMDNFLSGKIERIEPSENLFF
ncbi:MAG: radical SAM protein [Candidatus Margulisbacteria bacterium]|jgi:molybdenum cofactor biosynthesis enzyme MoaA|nr:radical SAM protein [Candidatus Margulisiibacteriota bacterium]